MMTLKQFTAKPETISMITSWYLADLGEVLRNLQKAGKVECLGRGPGAPWKRKGNTLKRG
jgi:hypothetical protein